MANEVIAPFLSYEDINHRADEFLMQHGRCGTLPVDIEALAEFDLGLDIFPFPHLQETFDVEGFISGDLTTIYVDEFIYYQRPTRYRFSIAHEVGHYVFHSDLMAAIHPQNIADWKGFVLGIDEEAYGWLEYQAYTFAAAETFILSTDSLVADSGLRVDYVLTNPPFGKKSSMTFTNEEGEQEKEDLTYNRQDFWATTSNKQLNFVQHIRTMLKTSGKAAVVVPDNVLFEGGAGETVRKRLLETTDLQAASTKSIFGRLE
jgi:hypothetical protein